MRNTIRIIPLAAASLLALAACSSGGGGASTSGLSTAMTPASGSSGSAGASGSSSSTGSTGSSGSSATGIPIFAANRATLGANTVLLATGTATASPPTSIPVGTIFPLRQTAIVSDASKNAASAAADVDAGGSSLTVLGTGTSNGATMAMYQLKVPALGIDVAIPLTGTATSGQYSVTGATFDLSSRSYLLLSNWTASAGTVQYQAYGVTGYQTPPAGVPTSGQATYTGTVVGSVYSIAPPAVITGGGTVSIDFGTAAVTGTFSPLRVQAGGTNSNVVWNGVALSGSLSGAVISGTTSVTSVPTGSLANGYTVASSATGFVDGALFGPNGQEIGLIWSLYDGSQPLSKLAVGTFSGAK